MLIISPRPFLACIVDEMDAAFAMVAGQHVSQARNAFLDGERGIGTAHVGLNPAWIGCHVRPLVGPTHGNALQAHVHGCLADPISFPIAFDVELDAREAGGHDRDILVP